MKFWHDGEKLWLGFGRGKENQLVATWAKALFEADKNEIVIALNTSYYSKETVK